MDLQEFVLSQNTFLNMKFTIELSDFQVKVIYDLINREEFADTILAELLQTINRIFTSSLRNLKNSWREQLLEEGVNICLEDEELLALIFAHPDYQDKLDREIEAEAIRTSKFEIK